MRMIFFMWRITPFAIIICTFDSKVLFVATYHPRPVCLPTSWPTKPTNFQHFKLLDLQVFYQIRKIVFDPVVSVGVDSISRGEECEDLGTLSSGRYCDLSLRYDLVLIPGEYGIELLSDDDLTEEGGACGGDHGGIASKSPVYKFVSVYTQMYSDVVSTDPIALQIADRSIRELVVSWRVQCVVLDSVGVARHACRIGNIDKKWMRIRLLRYGCRIGDALYLISRIRTYCSEGSSIHEYGLSLW